MQTINCRGELVSLSTPRIMGIVNTTPDSFYSNSRVTANSVIRKVEQMLIDGADFIDIGGYSSRPNAQDISQEQEIERTIPIIELLLKEFPKIRISIDTFRSEVARQGIEQGACMINDISAGNLDPNMWNVIAHYQVPYVMMHLRGTPQTMQQYTSYEDILKEIIFYFSEKKQKAQSLGINDLIIDPGFGFSKNLDQNYQLFAKLKDFQILDTPILVGISRKSMIFNLLEISNQEALNGTSVLNTIALLYGANILRVHDVKEAVECLKIVKKIKEIR